MPLEKITKMIRGYPRGIYCLGCDYDLRGLPAGRRACPECGRQFDVSDRRSYARQPWWRRRMYLVATLAILLFVTSSIFISYGEYRYRRYIAPLYGFEKKYADMGVRVDPLEPTWLWKLLPKRYQDAYGKVKLLDYYGSQAPKYEVDIIYRYPSLEALQVCFTQADDDTMKYVKGLDRLEDLSIHDTAITDNGIKHLAGHPNLIELDASNTMLTDEGLKYIATIKSMERLYIENTQITDDGMRTIAAISKLKHLDVSGNKITDDGLAALAKMDNLGTLRATDTLITGRGLRYLRECKNLEEVEIGGAVDVDYQAVEEFKDIRPNVRVTIKNRSATK